MAKQEKNFKENVTENFISPQTPPDDPEFTFTPPKGYRIVPETKSAKLQLLLTPRLKEDLKTLAKKQGTSVNNLINTVMSDYVEGAKK